MNEVVIRRATEADVPAMNAIYNEYIVDSHMSFDVEPWSDQKRLEWFRARVDVGYPVLVACEADMILVVVGGAMATEEGLLGFGRIDRGSCSRDPGAWTGHHAVCGASRHIADRRLPQGLCDHCSPK